jgi:hypothetical protein
MTIEAKPEAEEEWKAGLDSTAQQSLYPYTDSWWNTSNVPGKKTENHNYIWGLIGVRGSVGRL